MKLSTRVLLLVAPVVMLSAAMSSYSIYINQKDTLIKRENSYLQLTMEKLAGHFRQSVSLINSYSLTLIKSDIIRHYFSQPDNPYREMRLIEIYRRQSITYNQRAKMILPLRLSMAISRFAFMPIIRQTPLRLWMRMSSSTFAISIIKPDSFRILALLTTTKDRASLFVMMCSTTTPLPLP